VGGALVFLIAPRITDVSPDRWGEPMNCPKGSFLFFRAGRRLSPHKEKLNFRVLIVIQLLVLLNG
jgi:hypothetical protein